VAPEFIKTDVFSIFQPGILTSGYKPIARNAFDRRGTRPMSKDTFRVVTRGTDGEIRIRDYDSSEALLKRHNQIGVDDCSTDLGLRGLPVFRGLIGPIPEGKNIIRYESPEVFETLTKEWSAAKAPRRRSRAKAPETATPVVETVASP